MVKIIKRLERIYDDNFGDYNQISPNLYELRFFFGKGYRFFRSLELVIKSRDGISGFCEKAGIDCAMLYQIFNGERVSRVDALAKILKTLGLTLKVG